MPLTTLPPPVQAYRRPGPHVLAELQVDADLGLAEAEATRRRDRFGPNELASAPPTPRWRRFLRQFRDPLVYLLLVAVAISTVAWWVEGAHGLPIDALVIALIVLANAVIGLIQEQKAVDAVAALADMTAATSMVLRDGSLRSVPSADLVPGDILVLAEGDAVGADARLVSCADLSVEEASLTGESAATSKSLSSLGEEVPLGDRHTMVYKGTAVVRGVGRAVVVATGMRTEMGAIAAMLADTTTEPSPLERELVQVSKKLGLLVAGIAIVVMTALALLYRITTVDEAVEVLLMGVSLAVAAVPEGLPAILSLVLAVGVQRMAHRKAVMKNLHSVETLGSASVICSDKTGTLTRNEMTLHTVVTASGEVEFTGTGYVPAGQIVGEPDPVLLEEVQHTLAAGVVTNNAQLAEVAGEWRIEGDPTEAAFLVAQHKLAGVEAEAQAFTREAEVPFSSERKMMSVLVRSEEPVGRMLTSKGAADVLLTHCTAQMVGREVVPLTDAARFKILAAVSRLSGEGYRTLGVAARPADDAPTPDALDAVAEEGLVFLGIVGIIDPPRDEAAAAIAEAHRAGIRTLMITGDHPVTAQRIASDLGIAATDDRVLTGAELTEFTDAEFTRATQDVSVFARVVPEHKLRIVDVLQADGHVVAMTGDGVNDAPALKSADIGIAMGQTGTEVTKEAATMILGDDNYATIVDAVRQGRIIFDNIRKFLRYLLSSNMGEVVTVFFGVVLAGVIGLSDPADPDAIVVPLLATQILWINLITDSGPALAMGVDPVNDDVMARAPRQLNQRIIDGHMWGRILFIGMVMGAATLATIDWLLPGGLIEGTESLDVARTAGFTTLVMAQLFNALNARSDLGSAFGHLFTNAWLWGAIALAVVLQFAVVHVPFMQQAFGTTALTLHQWLLCIGMGAVVLVAEEIVKLVRRVVTTQ
ncbi:MAG: cation-translocating P-type ATPase [Propioniciclava sp.]